MNVCLNNYVNIAPSMLSADFGFLADETKRAEDAGADFIHIDIMDGHFVPNFAIGIKALAAIRKNTKLPLDVHLMIYNPFNYIERFIENGADIITVHFEADENIEDTLEYIRRCGKKASIASNPETSLSFIPSFINKCDMMVFMTVNPGFGGQKFLPKVLDKVKLAKKICNEMKKDILLQVDGGINAKTAPLCIKAGANFLSSGNYLFNECSSMSEGIKILRGQNKKI